MRKKLQDAGGLTVVEMLCAVAILVLLVMMMATGMQMAVRSYYAVTSESETQLLVSSLSSALADKLRFAVVSADGSGGYRCSIGKVEAPDGKVLVGGKALLPDGAYGNPNGAYQGNYQVKGVDGAEIVVYQKDTHCFTVRFAVTDNRLDITQTAEFTVRCLSPVKKEGMPP